MLKKILLASLLALGLNAASLAVDSVVDNLKIKDQNEVEKVIDTNVKTILFASDKSTSDMLRDYLLPLSEKENILEKNGAVYVADISGMPSLISKFIALPKMKKYPFSVLLLCSLLNLEVKSCITPTISIISCTIFSAFSSVSFIPFPTL